MGALSQSKPLRASIGTWVSPLGQSFAFLRQIAFSDDSPFVGRDAEEILAPTYGSGPPIVGTNSFFYVDSDSDTLYFRAVFGPARYVAINP